MGTFTICVSASISLISLSPILHHVHVLWLSFHPLHQAKIGSVIYIPLWGVWLSIWDGFLEISYWEPRKLEGFQVAALCHWAASLFPPFFERCEFDLFIGHQGCHFQQLATETQRALRENSLQSSIWGMPNGSPGSSWYCYLLTAPEVCTAILVGFIILLLTMKSNIKTKLTMPLGMAENFLTCLGVPWGKLEPLHFSFLIHKILISNSHINKNIATMAVIIVMSQGYCGN